METRISDIDKTNFYQVRLRFRKGSRLRLWLVLRLLLGKSKGYGWG